MPAPAPNLRFTYDNYLAIEAASPERYEFLGGQLVSMAGHTRDHDDITSNVSEAIRGWLRLQGGPCKSQASGVKVRVEHADASFYPDLHVTCDPSDRADPRVSRAPRLIVEVLSESTRDYDRGDKFDAYKCLNSLEEYLLIDSQVQAVVLHRRTGTDRWLAVSYGPEDTVTLETIGLALPVARLYADTETPLPRPRPRLAADGSDR